MAKFYKVGGCVRDKLLGVPYKDIDFSVEAKSYEDMRQAILDRGCKIFLENPEFVTIRARDPEYGGVDFVLCRRDGEYIDCRHPESVQAGSLLDDLARRDFTMNAIAEDESGKIHDPFNGREHMQDKVIRCVGNAADRFNEDALRMIRAIRFAVTKEMHLSHAIQNCLRDKDMVDKITLVSVERIREELLKAFAFSTLNTLLLLERYHRVRDLVFDQATNRDLRLMPTLKEF